MRTTVTRMIGKLMNIYKDDLETLFGTGYSMRQKGQTNTAIKMA